MARNGVKRVSSLDVARVAGVSQSTVSRVYNQSNIPVSEEKRKRILEAAENLGYRPSLIARSLNLQFTKIIGIVMRHFDTAVYMNVLEMFIKSFQNKGYTTMVFNINENHEVEDQLQTALEYQVDGLIITSASLSSPLVKSCARFKTPVFLFNRVSETVQVNTVCHDNLEGGERIAEYFITRGHKKLVYVTGELSSSTNRDRQAGYLRKTDEMGIETPRIIEGDFTYTSGYRAAEKILKSGFDFDSIFCASDYMAMGFYDYVRFHSNLRIPDDFSLVGFDGITMYNQELYPITTYQQPFKRMVDKTIQLMIKSINNFSSEPSHYVYSGELIEAGSVSDRH